MGRHILVPLDGSDGSEAVLPHVETFALCANACVTLVTATGHVDGSVALETYLERTARRLRDRGIYVDCVVLGGAPADCIAKHANDRGFDIVAMCTHGRTGLKRLVLGSVTEDVLQSCRMPVMVVHPESPPPGPRPFRRIIVPVDDSIPFPGILADATKIAKIYGSRIVLLAVARYQDEGVSGALLHSRWILEQEGILTEVALACGDPARSILDYAGVDRRNLVALAAESDATLKVLRRARFPVMIFHLPAGEPDPRVPGRAEEPGDVRTWMENLSPA